MSACGPARHAAIPRPTGSSGESRFGVRRVRMTSVTSRASVRPSAPATAATTPARSPHRSNGPRCGAPAIPRPARAPDGGRARTPEGGARPGHADGHLLRPQAVEHLAHLGNQREPNVLVQPIAHRDEQRVRVEQDRGRGERCVPDVVDGVCPRELGRERAPRVLGRQPHPVGDQETGRRLGCGSNRPTSPSSTTIVNPPNVAAAALSGMPLELDRDRERDLRRTCGAPRSEERIRERDAGDGRRRARVRDPVRAGCGSARGGVAAGVGTTGSRPRSPRRTAWRGSPCRSRRSGARRRPRPPSHAGLGLRVDRDLVAQVQREAEAVEARAQVGRGGRDASR